jgi:hypothetical protein
VWVDQAGRQHRLYVWGDVPSLGTRILTSGKLRRRGSDLSESPLWLPGEDWRSTDDGALVNPFDEFVPEVA